MTVVNDDIRYTSLLDQRNAILFTHKWIRGLPDDDGDDYGKQACLVARGKDFEDSVNSQAIDYLDAAVQRLYPWEFKKATVRRNRSMTTGGDPTCVFWNDRYGTEEKVLAVLDEAMRRVKDLAS